jgi:hypothetical protein
MVATDGIVVCDNIPLYRDALIIWFGLFFTMNVCYPKDLAATLEFVQRYVMVNHYMC